VCLADVAQMYTDIVTSMFSSTIAAKAWFATAALFETGLDGFEAAAAVQKGRGVMPAGLVSGQEQAVVAYVVSISSPTG
jgi:hypothetical protein